MNRTASIDSYSDRYVVEIETGCWLWTGRKKPSGYAELDFEGRTFRAHRFFYEVVHGPVSEDLELDHLCSVRHCVNPAHLEPVTHVENCRRASYVRLTVEGVQELHHRFAAWPGTCRKAFSRRVAGEYGVTDHAVYDALMGRTWRDVFDEAAA